MDEQDLKTTQKSVLIVATVSSFLTPLSLATVNVALPSIGRAFSADAITLNWVATIYLLTAAMFLVPFGKISDIYGRRKIFIYGMWVFTVSSLCLGLAPSTGSLLAFRAIQGIGSSMVFGTGVAMLTSVYPPGERGHALGINIAAVYLGLSCGPFVGGILTQHLGWRSVFLFNSAPRFLRDLSEHKKVEAGDGRRQGGNPSISPAPSSMPSLFSSSCTGSRACPP